MANRPFAGYLLPMDLLEFLVEVVLNVADVCNAWRFAICVCLSAGAIALVNWLVLWRGACLPLAVLIGIAGVVSGFAWEWRAGA